MIFHNPLPCLGVIVGEEGNADVGAVDVGERTADSDDAAPRAGADHGAKIVGLEAPGEEVAVGSGILIDEQHLR